MLKLDHVMGVQLYILKLNLALPASACGLGVRPRSMTYFFLVVVLVQAYYCTSTRYRIRSRNARARGSDSGRARILDKKNYDIWTIKTNSKCKIIRYFNKYINQREAVLSNADLKLKFTFRNQKNSHDFTRFLQLSSFATVHRLVHTRTMPGMACHQYLSVQRKWCMTWLGENQSLTFLSLNAVIFLNKHAVMKYLISK